MQNFTPQMLRDLLASPDPKDQEFARQLADLEFSNENARLANYPAPVPPPAPVDNSALNSKYIRGDIGEGGAGGMAIQDMPFPQSQPSAFRRAAQPAAPAAPVEQELIPNQFRNERTGKVTTLSAPSTQQQMAKDNEPVVLDQMRQQDGSIFQLVKVFGLDSDGRQSSRTITRVVMPPELDPLMAKAQKYRKGETEIAASRASTKRDEAATAKINEEMASGKKASIPQGYRLSKDGNLEAIPGGPADQKIAAKYGSDVATLQSMNSDMDRLATAANELLNHKGLGRITGVSGVIPNIPGFAGADAEAKLETLKSQVGFGVLQNMRNASKTGGALGQVSDVENKLLQANLAALAKAQSEEQMKESLAKIITYAEGAKGRLAGAFDLTHNRNSPATSAKEVTMEDVFQAAKKTGKTIDQVKKDAVAKGYRVRGM